MIFFSGKVSFVQAQIYAFVVGVLISFYFQFISFVKLTANSFIKQQKFKSFKKRDHFLFSKWFLIFRFTSKIKNYLFTQFSQIGLVFSKKAQNKLFQEFNDFTFIFFLCNSKIEIFQKIMSLVFSVYLLSLTILQLSVSYVRKSAIQKLFLIFKEFQSHLFF